MFIYIVRHGETEWNKLKKTQGIQNVSLSDEGRKQAYRLGERLEGESISYIYSSDLDRALETASIIGKRINVSPTPVHLLREVCFGAWEGLTLDEIESKYPGQLKTWSQDIDFHPPNGESIRCVLTRVQQFIQFVKERHAEKDEKILVVSHALTCKVLILELLGIPAEYQNRIRLGNTGLSLIEYSEERKHIIFMNDTCHI